MVEDSAWITSASCPLCYAAIRRHARDVRSGDLTERFAVRERRACGDKSIP